MYSRFSSGGVSQSFRNAKGWFKSSHSKIIIFVIAFTAIGALTVALTRAAQPAVNIEAENGTTTDSARVFASGSASSGEYVQFTGSTNTSPCTIYVSPSGGGSGANVSSPTSLSNGINQTIPGSVVCLLGGDYNHTSNITSFKSGTSSAWITYRNYDSTPPVIKFTGPKLSGGQFQLDGTNNWDGQHHIIFDGLTFDGANNIGGAIFVKDGSHHITMRNLTIKNPGASGLALNAVDYVRAENNKIYHGGYNQGWSSGISLWYGGDSPVYGGSGTNWFDNYQGFHNVIANNVISGWYDNSTAKTDGNGIIIDASINTPTDMPPVLIIGNVVYSNYGRGIQNRGSGGNVWTVNNTVYANGLTSGKPNIMAQKASNEHWLNNISYGRSSSASNYHNDSSAISGYSSNIYFNGTNVSGSSSWFYTGTALDPKFVSPPPISSYSDALAPWDLGNKLSLQPTSPAINHGVDPKTASGMNATLLEVLNQYLAADTAGRPRYNGTIDIGAYEY